jgi:ectoine hydroxylase-related dioxygenase (phytanoyl-CoA dioxygenase family)
MSEISRFLLGGTELSPQIAGDLDDHGFVVLEGPLTPAEVKRLKEVYDSAVRSASPDNSVGSTSIRVNDFVNRGAAFDELYIYPPVLLACRLTIGGPFKLSTLHARTVIAGARAQELHLDCKRDTKGWPLVGFIYMVDDFRVDNGATRFVTGSHKWPDDQEPTGNQPTVPACGPAGSLVVFNGSVWHGHSANSSNAPRRSIQGAYIRRDMRSAIDMGSRMTSETSDRISPLAKYLLNI